MDLLTNRDPGRVAADAAPKRSLHLFHADSLAGPMKALKAAFEAGNPGISVHLVSGRSRELAERILNAEACDLFIPSALSAIDAIAASWSVVFSANEMVLIVAGENPRGIRQMIDLAGAGIRFTRVTGEKDMATQRSVEFIRSAARLEGRPELAPVIIGGAAVDPVEPHTVPQTVADVASGRADAGVVYLSAAVAEKEKLEILRFPPAINLSGEIRNAATVPATAKERAAALRFVQFLLSAEGKAILEATGQPPIVPPIFNGRVPAELK